MPKKEEPVVIPAAQEPPPVAEIKPKQPRKRSIRKEFNDAAEKPERDISLVTSDREEPAPAPEEDKPKKKPRKRSIRKDFNDAAEKKPKKKAAPKRKHVRKATA